MISGPTIPGASPGARIQEGTAMSSGSTRWVMRRCSPAYICREGLIAISGNSLVCEELETASSPKAMIVPSAWAPIRRCWEVAGRYPVSANMCWRVTACFTARPGTACAAIAVSIMSAWGRPLEPKPPPTCGLMIRSCSGSMPSIGARVCRAGCTPWVEVHSVSCSPSQRAMVVCGSIGLLCSRGVEYRWSTTISAAASAASRSPVSMSSAPPSGSRTAGWSGRKSASCGAASVVTTTRSAAWRAVSGLSARTAPRYWPRKPIRSSWRIASSPSSVSASRRAFSWVITRTTPSSASAAVASIAVTRPSAIVEHSGKRYSGSSTGCS